MIDNFAVIILTYKRPDRVYTYTTLRRAGYTGRVIFILSNDDPTINEYKRNYPDVEIITFDKSDYMQPPKYDLLDNDWESTSVPNFARNAAFDIAVELGLEYFLELDDDYTQFAYRFDGNLDYYPPGLSISHLDDIFAAYLEFLETSGFYSICMAQGGDFIGGKYAKIAKRIAMKFKAMNTFFITTKRPFRFLGRFNEDVNTYVHMNYTGRLMATHPMVSIVQIQSQAQPGGVTELYRQFGTYRKSFYPILLHPAGVKITMLHTKHRRIHHHITYDATVPKIVPESIRKL